MKIDWWKLGLYGAIAFVGYGVYFTPKPEPRVEYRTVTQTKTVEVPGPTVVKEVIKEVPAKCNCAKPVAKAPVPVVKPRPKFVPRARNTSAECTLVPAAAYAHPQDVVVASATRQGLTGEPLNILKRCIGAS